MDYRTQAHHFLKELELQLIEVGILNEILQQDVDHLCFRTETENDYRRTCMDFSKFSTLLIETIVNGRPISTFKLKEPISWKGQIIDIVEVPAPKLGRKVRRGFEHIEALISESFETFTARHSSLKFDFRGAKKTMNPEIELMTRVGGVKFHHMPLEAIVRVEKKNRVMEVIDKQHLLKDLQQYYPIISGSVPAGLDLENSDFDILCEVHNFEVFEQHLRSLNINDLQIRRLSSHSLPAVVAQFVKDGLKFEIFAQSCLVYRQWSHRHFIAEYRMVKYLGESFRQNVIAAKQRGLNTENAIAEVLSIPGDAYKTLHDWSLLSVEEFRKKIDRRKA